VVDIARQLFRNLLIGAWYVSALVVVLIAIIFVSARLLLPYAGDYKDDVSKELTDYLGQTIKINKLSAEWHAWGPALVLNNVTLMNKTGDKPALKFSKLRLDFNVITSLFSWRPMLSGIALVNVNLALARDKKGHISVAGIESKEDTGDTNELTAWVLSQGKLSLERSNISWQDEMNNGRKMQFSAVNATLRNAGNRHVLDASMDLPKSLGKNLVLHIDTKGELLNPDKHSAKIYLQGSKIRLAELLSKRSIDGVSAQVGDSDFQLWANWQNGALQRIEGKIGVDDIVLSSNKESQTGLIGKSLAFQKLSGKFRWVRNDSGWQFDVNDLVLARKNHKWQPARIAVKIDNGADSNHTINAYASYLQVNDTVQLLTLFLPGNYQLRTQLQAIKPQGQLFDVNLNWKSGDHPSYHVYARLDRVTTQAWKLVPDANNVVGQLWLNTNSGQAILEHAAMKLNFPKIFRRPIQVDELKGKLGWKHDGEGWQLSGRDLIANNQDIRSRGTLDIIRENSDVSPFMSLIAWFEDGNGSRVGHYLPTGIMPNSAVKWLDTAIKGGHIVSGGTIMHGRLSDFPFDGGKGKFEVRFGVEDGSLNYAKGWPIIHGIDADVQFLGRSMFIDAKHGEIFSNNIQWASVTLPNMTHLPMQLLVSGDIKGPTQEKLDYLVASPQLNQSFGRYLEGMKANGNSLLHLDLDLPIGDYRNVFVDGWADLANDSLTIPPLGSVLSDINGRLHFYHDGLKADAINAKLFGQKSSIKVSTEDLSGKRTVKISAAGSFDAKDLATSYIPTLRDAVEGKSLWSMSFDIPVKSKEGESRLASLQVKSDFKGVEVKLPPPLNKKSEDASPLDLRVNFPPGKAPRMTVNYGDHINGIFELAEKAVAGIKRGELRLDDGIASLPKKDGIYIEGRLGKIKLKDWLAFLPPMASTVEPAELGVSLFGSAKMTIDQLEAYGQHFHHVRLSADAVDSSLQFHIASDEATGQVVLPKNLVANPVRANLKQLYLAKPELEGGAVDPRSVPSLDLQIKDLRYDNRRLGSLKLQTTRVADGLRIEQLVLEPKSTRIITQGGWYTRAGEQNSRIQANLKSTDIGQTLKELGYVGGIAGGNGEVNLDLQWPSAFFDPNVKQVKGSLNMELKNGQLLDIDPGAGRLFGMLSLQALPRRLSLDFRDVFAKGFGFDRIKGNFHIQNGNATTKNLYLDGPAARIEVTGRVGLARQDYDQLVTVTPKVTETLPLIGALAATPQVGAVILFFQKLFQPGIEEATRNQYTITGSWSDPKIRKVKPPKHDANKGEVEQLQDSPFQN
jgi:uncharacterized protein (TIGR02099 family)